jgi:hypothetical protein
MNEEKVEKILLKIEEVKKWNYKNKELMISWLRNLLFNTELWI